MNQDSVACLTYQRNLEVEVVIVYVLAYVQHYIWGNPTDIFVPVLCVVGAISFATLHRC